MKKDFVVCKKNKELLFISQSKCRPTRNKPLVKQYTYKTLIGLYFLKRRLNRLYHID